MPVEGKYFLALKEIPHGDAGGATGSQDTIGPRVEVDRFDPTNLGRKGKLGLVQAAYRHSCLRDSPYLNLCKKKWSLTVRADCVAYLVQGINSSCEELTEK